jgi:hypothetical protein
VTLIAEGGSDRISLGTGYLYNYAVGRAIRCTSEAAMLSRLDGEGPHFSGESAGHRPARVTGWWVLDPEWLTGRSRTPG